MAISLHGIRERYLECSVCFQEYNDEEKVPRFLPCNHTYCETCLRTLMRNNGIKCPQCNQEHRVEEITCLPKDNTRRDLRTFLEENKEVPIQYQCCNICPENIPARLYCNTCGLYLCVGCFKKKHKYEGTISHSFTNIHHENFLPDKFTTCERSGHEKGRLKYFGKSQTLSKPGCATCIIEDNSKMLSKKLNYSKDILEQRYAYIDKEKEKLSSIQNSINSEISLIDIFMAELISKASLFQRKVEDLCQSESREMKNKSIMIGNINRAMKNDKRILDVGLRKLKNRQTHVNECFGFLSVIAEIEDALLFYELYTYIMEIVDDMGQTPVEHFDFNTVSSLRECSLTVIEMEKEIKLKDIKSKISTKRKSLKSQVCIGILVWIVMQIFLALLPGRWFRLFEADATSSCTPTYTKWWIICGMPLESVIFTKISALSKCVQMVDEMEKNIIMKKEEDMVNLENEKVKDYERKTTKDKFQIRNTPTRVCVVIMIVVTIITILLLPAQWVFGSDHWLFVPDMDGKPSIQNEKDISFYHMLLAYLELLYFLSCMLPFFLLAILTVCLLIYIESQNYMESTIRNGAKSDRVTNGAKTDRVKTRRYTRRRLIRVR